VQVVSQEFGAALSTMSIKDSEELNLKLGLLAAVWLDARLFQVEHN
jgi:hypothetical protein